LAKLKDADAIVAVSASGSTPYVLGVADQARRTRALLVALTCAPGSPIGRAADVAIEADAGPEVIAGSTRLKAGTVQKTVLNMISTGVFTRLGYTYRGRMVGVSGANAKQRARAIRLLSDLTGVSPAEAEAALSHSRWNARVAILMLRRGDSAADAEARLSGADRDLAAAPGARRS